MKSERLPQLDTLRGLAALSVFWGHALGMKKSDEGYGSLIGVLFNGEADVLLFFVLSGFVLNLKYTRVGRPEPGWVRNFITRRIFRIVPAYLVVLAIAIFFRQMVFDPRAPSYFTEWTYKYWRLPLHARDVLAHVSLIGPGIDSSLIDPPLWSLVVEMRISLLFPLVIVLVNRDSKRLGADALLMTLVYAVGLWSVDRLGSLVYLPYFFLGAIVAKRWGQIRDVYSRMSLGSKLVALGLSLALRQAAALTSPWNSLTDPMSPLLGYGVKQLVGLGAAGLIAICACSGSLKSLLDRPFGRFIGETSYSFYMINMIFLLGLGPIVFGATSSLVATWLVCIALSYASSYAIYKLVEMPMNRLGYRVARAYVPPAGASSPSA